MANPRLGWVANKAIKRWKMYRRTPLGFADASADYQNHQRTEQDRARPQIGPATAGSIDNMASREEQPTAHDWAPKSRSAPSAAPGERACDAPAGQAVPNQAVPRSAVAAILLRLVLPSPPRRSAPANRMAQTSQLLRRTTSIWPPFLSHTPMRTALRQ